MIGVERPEEYALQDFRRGHARDLVDSGCSLAQLLAAGSGPALFSYFIRTSTKSRPTQPQPHASSAIRMAIRMMMARAIGPSCNQSSRHVVGYVGEAPWPVADARSGSTLDSRLWALATSPNVVGSCGPSRAVL